MKTFKPAKTTARQATATVSLANGAQRSLFGNSRGPSRTGSPAVRELPEEGLQDRGRGVGGQNEAGGRRNRETPLRDEEGDKSRDDPLVDVVEEVSRGQQGDRAASHGQAILAGITRRLDRNGVTAGRG